jgi:hypothetical protein
MNDAPCNNEIARPDQSSSHSEENAFPVLSAAEFSAHQLSFLITNRGF